MRIAKRVALEPPGEPNLTGIKFGTDVNIVGNFLVVGAPGHTADKGAAYIFQRSKGVWNFTQRLASPTGKSGDEFGYSVSISRAYNVPVVAVGAPLTDQQGLSSGSVEVFEMKGGRFVWAQMLVPPANVGHPGAQFGHSVDADGFMIAVGSIRQNNVAKAAIPNTGAVFIYSKATTTSRYVLAQALYGEQRDQMFGKNVRVKGVFPFTGPRVVLAGAPNSAPNGYGAAYLYRWSGRSWYFKQKLAPSEASIGIQARKAGSGYGTGISLTTDPEVAMIGGVNASGPQSPTSGAAYMWNLLNDQYRQSSAGLYPDGSTPNARFGESIVRVRDTVMIGSPGFTPQSNQGLPVPEEGTAYTFVKCTDNTFNQTGMIRLPNRQRLANLGSIVEMDDRMLFVGAPGYNSGSDPKGKPGRGVLFVYPFVVTPVESELHYQGDPPNVIKNCPGREFPCPHTLYSALQAVRIGCLLLKGETPISNIAQTAAPVRAGNGRVPGYAVPGKIRVPNNLTNGETVDLRLVQLDPATGREVKKTKAPLRVIPCNFNTNQRIFQRVLGI
ncbi:hypothetical protein NDN08_000994 [Rhodosorus marinus]|uniref:Uncharacterized protein n=1 Tax=Rhodosorus marinus TaxID=101924 RepID=A0AAV8UTR4_9RHOD|nr:hypothetical protein NDN08_000994 [Rhodosorus marinus]